MNIFVFDFDDTLFPTTFLNGYPPFYFKELCESIETLLEKSLRQGDVYIITNAKKSWVDYCLNTFLIDCEFLKKIVKGENFFSTADNFSNIENTSLWKYEGFKKKLSGLFEKGGIKQILSFGDSENDRFATFKFAKSYPNILVKNILLSSFPTLENLICEHKIIFDMIDIILKQNEDADLKFTVTPSEFKEIEDVGYIF